VIQHPPVHQLRKTRYGIWMSMGDQSDPAPTSAPVEKNPLWNLDENGRPERPSAHQLRKTRYGIWMSMGDQSDPAPTS